MCKRGARRASFSWAERLRVRVEERGDRRERGSTGVVAVWRLAGDGKEDGGSRERDGCERERRRIWRAVQDFILYAISTQSGSGGKM